MHPHRRASFRTLEGRLTALSVFVVSALSISVAGAQGAVESAATRLTPLESAATPQPAVAGPEVPQSDTSGPSKGASAPARDGAVGLDTILSADPGKVGTCRLRVTGLLSSSDGFPVSGTENTFRGTTFGMGCTPLEVLELYGSLKNTTNENAGTRPIILQTQGDLTLGAKGGYWVMPSLAIGGSASAHFASGLGDGGIDFGSTGFWLRALTTADWHRTGQAPLRALLDVGYYVEGGDGVIDGAPQRLDPIQEWGLQVSSYDRVTVALGLEAPVSEYISPYLEYHLDVPLQVELTRRADLKDDFTFASVPHVLAPGLRGHPTSALSIDLGVRIGLSDEPYLGVPATPPWMVFGSVSFVVDPQPAAPVAPPLPPAAPLPVKGTITGRVVSEAGEALVDARIDYVGFTLTRQLVDSSGRFTSYEFVPGKVKVKAQAKGYLNKEVEANVVAGTPAVVELKLAVDPTQAETSLVVQVVSLDGTSIASTLRIGSQNEYRGETTDHGPWKGEVKPGKYAVTASAAGHRSRTMEIEAKGGEPNTLRLALERSGPSSVSIRGRQIVLKKPIKFPDTSSRLRPDAEAILDEIAALLSAHSEIEKVRIDGHTDSGGDLAVNLRLSNERAKAVQSYLVAHGISDSRLDARGKGGDKPLAPNLTRRIQERNRRVEFYITEQRK